jgi:hypothetical protein
MGLASGLAGARVLQTSACLMHPMHHTDTLNFHTVAAGNVELLLDCGPHLLELGNSVVLPGVDHG